MSTRLKELATLVTACSDSSERPYVALEHVGSGTGKLLPNSDLIDRQPPEAGAASVEVGDVLFGKLRPYLAKSWLVDRRAYASTELLCLRPGKGIDSRWLSYVVASRPFVDWAVATSDGTKMPRTSWEKLAEFRVVCPGLVDQRAVADYLDAETARIDALIEKKSRMIELLQSRFGAWREQIMISDIRVTWIPLHHLTDPRRPIVYGIVQAGDEVPNGVPYIKSGDVLDLQSEGLSRTSPEIDESYRRARVHPGDIVIAMRASIGAVVIVPPDLPTANLTQGTARVAARHGIDSEWLFHALRCRAVQEQCEVRAVGTTFKTLNIWDLRRVNIPTPIKDQQHLLAERVGAADASVVGGVETLSRQIDLLTERRQAMITAAISGELEVPGVAA